MQVPQSESGGFSSPVVSPAAAASGFSFRSALEQSAVAICFLSGPDFVVTMANAAMLTLWGVGQCEVINRRLAEVLPDSGNQGFLTLLEGVFRTGQTFVTHEMPVNIRQQDTSEVRYVKFVYQPLPNESGVIDGIMIMADNITESVNARLQLEASEIRNRLTIEAGNMGSFEWIFSESRLIYSERFAEIFGLDPSRRYVQEDFVSLIHPQDRKHRDDSISQSMVTGKLFYEARVIRPDRSLVWIRAHGMVEHRDGKPYRMFGMILDITSQKQQSEHLESIVRSRTESLERKNQELIESEKRYQRMTEEIQDYAILLLDLDGTILNWNKGAEKIKGYSEEEIIGMNFRKFYLPEDKLNGLPERLISDAARLGKAMHEGYRVRKDGSVFWGVISITAVHDENGNVIGFSKVTRDLTELKQAQDQLHRYTAELEFRNQELEQFAYIASHDLQEPLRKIRMFTGLLAVNLDKPDQVARYYDKIDSAAARMSELIQSVLNYSRLNRDSSAFQQIELNTILDQVLQDLEVIIAEKQAKITKGNLPKIKGLPMQLTQLLANLIGNALKFSVSVPDINVSCKKAEAAEVEAVSGLDPEKRYHCLKVTDNGIGFEQQYAAQIFTIFQRLNSKSDFQGTGIGLALCKKIAENHGGGIAAYSEPGKGAEFRVFLPA